MEAIGQAFLYDAEKHTDTRLTLWKMVGKEIKGLSILPQHLKRCQSGWCRLVWPHCDHPHAVALLLKISTSHQGKAKTCLPDGGGWDNTIVYVYVLLFVALFLWFAVLWWLFQFYTVCVCVCALMCVDWHAMEQRYYGHSPIKTNIMLSYVLW